MDVELMNCKAEVEKQILSLEGDIKVEVTQIKAELHALNTKIAELVTLARYRPVELLVYGGASGILMAALGAVMAKLLGWTP